MVDRERQRKVAMQVTCAVITVSNSVTERTDDTGKTIISQLRGHDHIVDGYKIVKDKPEAIQGALREFMEKPKIQAIVLNGGIGIGRGTTIEAIDDFKEKELPGFGEALRSLIQSETGAPAILSRAEAFTSEKKIIFALPGAASEAKLAMEKLICHNLGKIIWEIND